MKRKIFSVFFALVLVVTFSLVTAVPAMVKGPAGKGNPASVQLETLSVEAQGAIATSTITLVSGLTYRFEVSGMYSAGAGITADAEYSSGPDSYEWRDMVEKYESYGEGLLEVKVDDEFVEWGEYNDEHVYTLEYVGTGSTVQFRIYDIFPSNNSGSLEVKIFATCTTIQDGTLVDTEDRPLVLGYDQYGYNYQAHMFNGRYCDYDRVIGGAYCDVNLVMKWNDAWLSNKDCDGDGKLDRHLGFDSYIGSGAWETNHQWGINDDGDKWTYFVKIVAVPDDAELVEGIWYTADETEIGSEIWGSFARILQVSNDKAFDEHGVLYKSPASPGFGTYKP